MPYLLNVLYALLLVACSPWLLYNALVRRKYREGLWTRLSGRVPIVDSTRPVVWLHGVSLGEINLLVPLVAEFQRRRPLWHYVVSTTTLTGYAAARARFPELTVFYCPLDFTWAVRTAIKRIKPTWLVLAELELWPNLIDAARRHGSRIAIVNGRLSQRSYQRYRRLGPWVRQTLAAVDIIAAQDETYAQRFRALSARPERVRVTGSIKFDGAQTDRRLPAVTRLARLAGLTDEDVVFLAGSTQAGEELAAYQAFAALAQEFPQLRLIVVPRHPHRFDEVAHLFDPLGVAYQRRSRLEQLGHRHDARVLLVDAMGELAAWWGTAHVAFVGGSLGTSRGGQNMLEPAGMGAAVCFGPHTRNFRDIVSALLERQAAVVVANEAELAAFVRRAVQDSDFAEELGQRAREFVASQRGATSRTVDLLLANAEPASRAA